METFLSPKERMKICVSDIIFNLHSSLCTCLTGVYPRPTREANKRFDEKMTLLETLMNKQQQLYATEERTLKVMMAEEEEEKDKETRKKFRHEMRQHGQAEGTVRGGFCTYYPVFHEGRLPYITDGDARRNFQKKPLKVTILGVTPANFVP